MKKRIAIMVAALVVLALLGAGLLLVLVDSKAWQDTVVQAAGKATGRTLALRAEPSLELLPPAIVLSNAALEEPGSSTSPLTIAQIKLYPTFSALFLSEKTLRKVEVIRPSLTLPVSDTLGMHAAQYTLSAIGGLTALAPEFVIVQGSLTLVGTGTDRQQLASDLALSFSRAADIVTLAGNGTVTGAPTQFGGQLTQGAGPLPFRFTMDRTGFGFATEGTLVPTTAGADFTGKITLRWPAPQGQKSGDLVLAIPVQKTGTQLVATPIRVEGAGSDGEASLSLTTDAQPTGQLQANFRTFDLDAWNALLAGEKKDSGQPLLAAYAGELLRRVGATVQVSIANATFRKQALSNLALSGTLQEGDMVVNQATGLFPGNSRLLAFGLLHLGTRSFEGSIEGEGENLKSLLSLAGAWSAALPDTVFKRFRLQTNTLLARDAVRFTESKLQIEEIKLAGTVLYGGGDKPKLEAALGVRDIDFDVLLPMLDAVALPVGELSAVAGAGKPHLAWLRALPITVELRTRIENFTLAGKPGESLAFAMVSGGKQAVFDSLAFTYGGMQGSGTVAFDVREAMPLVKAKLALTNFDTALLPEPPQKVVQEQVFQSVDTNEKWPKEPLNFDALKEWNADLELQVEQFRHHQWMLGGLATTLALRDAKLAIEKLTAKWCDGQLTATGTVTSGAVPGMSLNFSLANADAAQFFAAFSDLNTISGRLGINGTLSAAGINFYNWIVNLQGSLGVAGRNIRVERFDLPAIVKSVAAVRSVADIVNVSRLALSGGVTEFKEVSGDVFIRSGIVQPVGLRVRSDLAEGVITGNLSLPAWTMDTLLTLTLTSLAQNNPPTVGLKLKGPVENPQVAFDTQALETYVARYATERFLKSPQ